MKRLLLASTIATIAALIIGCGGSGGGNVVTTGGTGGNLDKTKLKYSASNSARMVRSAFAYAALSPFHSRAAEKPARHFQYVLDLKRQRTREEFQGYDENLGLYYIYTDLSETEARLELFTDAQFQNGAGQIDFLFESDPDVFPVSIVALYDVLEGQFAVTGDEIIKFESDTVANYDGVMTNSFGQGLSYFYEYSDDIVSGDTRMSGSFTLTDDTETEWTGDIKSSKDLVATITWTSSNGDRGELTYNPDGSGTLALFQGDSTTPVVTFVWDVLGVGTVTYSDGTTEGMDIDTFEP